MLLHINGRGPHVIHTEKLTTEMYTMTKFTAIFAAIALTTLGACTTMTQQERSVATGAAVGAVAGAALAGDNTQGRGAVVGATVGALAGNAMANR